MDIPALLGVPSTDRLFKGEVVLSISSQPDLHAVLQQACEQLCTEFFKPELGCLKDFKFKPDAKPVFCKPRVALFALLEDLNRAYYAGTA